MTLVRMLPHSETGLNQENPKGVKSCNHTSPKAVSSVAFRANLKKQASGSPSRS